MQKGDSFFNEHTIKGGPGYDGFTYLKPELGGAVNFEFSVERSNRK